MANSILEKDGFDGEVLAYKFVAWYREGV
ncbi:MAG: hypothetical protein ABEK59_06990 [Halobacteria archaeon]